MISLCFRQIKQWYDHPDIVGSAEDFANDQAVAWHLNETTNAAMTGKIVQKDIV